MCGVVSHFLGDVEPTASVVLEAGEHVKFRTEFPPLAEGLPDATKPDLMEGEATATIEI